MRKHQKPRLTRRRANRPRSLPRLRSDAHSGPAPSTSQPDQASGLMALKSSSCPPRSGHLSTGPLKRRVGQSAPQTAAPHRPGASCHLFRLFPMEPTAPFRETQLSTRRCWAASSRPCPAFPASLPALSAPPAAAAWAPGAAGPHLLWVPVASGTDWGLAKVPRAGPERLYFFRFCRHNQARWREAVASAVGCLLSHPVPLKDGPAVPSQLHPGTHHASPGPPQSSSDTHQLESQAGLRARPKATFPMKPSRTALVRVTISFYTNATMHPVPHF